MPIGRRPKAPPRQKTQKRRSKAGIIPSGRYAGETAPRTYYKKGATSFEKGLAAWQKNRTRNRRRR